MLFLIASIGSLELVLRKFNPKLWFYKWRYCWTLANPSNFWPEYFFESRNWTTSLSCSNLHTNPNIPESLTIVIRDIGLTWSLGTSFSPDFKRTPWTEWQVQLKVQQNWCLNRTKPHLLTIRRNHNFPIFLFIVHEKPPWSTSLLRTSKAKSCINLWLQMKEDLILKCKSKNPPNFGDSEILPELISPHSSSASSVRLLSSPSIIQLASHLAPWNSKQKRIVSQPLMRSLWRNALETNNSSLI